MAQYIVFEAAALELKNVLQWHGTSKNTVNPLLKHFFVCVRVCVCVGLRCKEKSNKALF